MLSVEFVVLGAETDGVEGVETEGVAEATTEGVTGVIAPGEPAVGGDNDVTAAVIEGEVAGVGLVGEEVKRVDDEALGEVPEGAVD